MNIPFEKSVVKTHNKLHKLPLGSITARGWLQEQLLRSKHGTGGHLDELEPDMIATPFINYSAFKKLPFENGPADPTFAAGWSSEISGAYWTGLVQLAFTLNDPELIANAERRQHMALTMKYSLVFIASAPMLVAYPFVQKFFVKGVMVGSLKG